MDYIGLGLLFFSILYTGRQAGLYLRMKKRMGKLLGELSPSKGQKKVLMIIGGVFILLFVIVTYSYLSQGIILGLTYAVILSAVIYSYGRFISKIVELRENGILGHINEIAYKDIRSYTFEERKKRGTLTLKLKDGRDFVILVSLSEIVEIKEILQKKI